MLLLYCLTTTPLCTHRRCCQSAGEYASAHRWYDQALQLDPRSADAHVARGAAHANERRLARNLLPVSRQPELLSCAATPASLNVFIQWVVDCFVERYMLSE